MKENIDFTNIVYFKLPEQTLEKVKRFEKPFPKEKYRDKQGNIHEVYEGISKEEIENIFNENAEIVTYSAGRQK
ncbi:hypothetical protein FACS1894166_12150 [Bacilli bacterium]|nr:hypothetical protein FACS1894166_12150 [Bacilli bacterium]